MSKRSISTFFLMSAIGVGAATAALAPEAQAGDSWRKCSEVKHAGIKSHCKEGKTTKSLKKVMKKWQKAAKAKSKTFKDGTKIKCTTCHQKGSGQGLKEEAAKKYIGEFMTLAGVK